MLFRQASLGILIWNALTTCGEAGTTKVCAFDTCGTACEIATPGPLTGTMNFDGSNNCARIPTISTSNLPSETAGVWGTLSQGPLVPSTVPQPSNAANTSNAVGPVKRALEPVSPRNAARYVSSLNPSWIHQGAYTSAMWFDFPPRGKSSAGVRGLYGCTAVFVVSSKGVYIAHLWEDPVFLKQINQLQNARTTNSWVLQKAVNPMLHGDRFTSSLEALKRTMGDPGPLSQVYKPRVILVTPYAPQTNPRQPPEFEHYQASFVGEQLAQSLLGDPRKYEMYGYYRSDQESAQTSSYKGRAIIEYEPVQEYLMETVRNTDGRTIHHRRYMRISKWRIWMSDQMLVSGEFYTYVVNPNIEPRDAASLGACSLDQTGHLSSAASSTSHIPTTHPTSASSSVSASPVRSGSPSAAPTSAPESGSPDVTCNNVHNGVNQLFNNETALESVTDLCQALAKGGVLDAEHDTPIVKYVAQGTDDDIYISIEAHFNVGYCPPSSPKENQMMNFASLSTDDCIQYWYQNIYESCHVHSSALHYNATSNTIGGSYGANCVEWKISGHSGPAPSNSTVLPT